MVDSAHRQWLRRCLGGVLGVALLLAGCSSSDDDDAPAEEEQRFPDVVEVAVERQDEDYDFTVTISSPYDSPERYADGWRVMGSDGTVYGEHELAHDHANEQPFTRTQTGVAIPDEIGEVVVEGRDSQNGYGGQTVTVELPGG